jgi:predicted phosphodiesterase
VAALEALRPASRFEYRIGNGKGAASGSFVTAPSSDAPSDVRFVVYGDTRSSPERHRSVAEAIAADRPAFVVCSGDLVGDGRVWEQWAQEFMQPAAAYLSEAVLWPVRGNHEEDAVLYRELFDLPGNELYYSFDFGSLHFVVLDCYSERAEMLDWLKRDLAACRAQWILVALHEPMFNVGGYASQWGREDFLPVLEEHGVDVVVAGHSHIYERFVPIGPPGRKPLIHIVSGGGGAPMYRPVPSPALAGGIGQSELHYCLFEVSGNRCDITVKRPDGSVMDSLLLVKDGDSYQSAVMAEAITTERAASLTSLFVGLSVDFPNLPQPGQTVRATLRGDALSTADRVAVSAAGESAGWEVVPREGALQNGVFSFEVKAPPDVKVDLRGLHPGLSVALSVTLAGRRFEAKDLPLRLGQRTIRQSIPEPEPVAVSRLRAPVSVDGDLSEWADVPSLPRPFQGADASSVRLCWRQEGLYGAAQVRDDSLRSDPQAPWRGDALELFIEKDFARAVERTERSAQYAFSPDPAAGPGPGHSLVAYGREGEAQAGIRCAWRPVEGGYALEFFLPAEVLAPAAMRAGTVMGLNFALSNDGVPVEQFYSDKNRDRGWGTPITWGCVRLSE